MSLRAARAPMIAPPDQSPSPLGGVQRQIPSPFGGGQGGGSAAAAALRIAARAWRELRKMRTAIILLAILALLATVGTLLPQLPQNPRGVMGYVLRHPVTAPWFARLGLFDIFSSWPFFIVAVLMYTSIGASMFIRVPAAWRRARDRAQVNHYVDYRGVKIYQAGFGWAPTLKIETPDGRVVEDTPTIFVGDPQFANGVIKAPSAGPGDQQLGVTAIFMPDPQIADQSIAPGTPQLRNPILLARLYRGDLHLNRPHK